MRYRPEIDGLRSFAVLPVMLFHADLGGFTGGYIGVDVFFVISGFLITSLLADALDQKNYSLLRFYERRARRLIPALATVLIATTIAAFFVMLPRELDGYARSLAASAGFVANVYFWLSSGYFATTAEELPLLHIWSLAVEEQFYLIFPPLLWALWKFGPRRRIWILWALLLVSFLLCVVGIADYPTATFFLLPTRAWELLAGSLCALHMYSTPRRGNGIAAAIGLGLILASALLFDEGTPFPSHFALLPVGGTILILRYAASGQAIYRLLTWPPLVGIGLISYSAYLWHQPLLALARLQNETGLSLQTKIGIVALTLGLATLTWRFVEQPFRGRPARLLPKQRGVFFASGGTLALLLSFGFWGSLSEGWRSTWQALRDPGVVSTYRLFETSERVADDPTPGECRISLFRDEDDRADFSSISTRLLECANAFGPGVAIIGDSHASDLFHAVRAADPTPFLVGLARGSCRFYDAKPGCPYDALAGFVADHPEVFGAIIYEQAGYPLLHSGEYGDSTRKMFTELSPTAPVEGFRPIEKRIDEPRAYLSSLAEIDGGPRIIWFGPRPAHYTPERYILRKGCNYSFAERPNAQKPFRDLDLAIERAVAGSNIEYLSQVTVMNLTFPEDLLDCDAIYWTDGDHLSAAGERRFGARFDLLSRLGL